MKKIFIFLCLIVILTFSCSTAVSAKIQNSESYSIENIHMNIQVPSNLITFTRTIDENDPGLKSLNLTKDKLEKQYKESGIFLDAVSPDLSYEITVTMNEDENSKSVYDLNSLSTAQTDALQSKLLNENQFYTDCTLYAHPQARFFRLTLYETIGDILIRGIQNYTVLNGQAIDITLSTYKGDITNEQIELLNYMVGHTYFTQITPSINTWNVGYLAVAIGIIILLLSVIVFISLKFIAPLVRKKCRKKKKKQSDDLKEAVVKHLTILEISKSPLHMAFKQTKKQYNLYNFNKDSRTISHKSISCASRKEKNNIKKRKFKSPLHMASKRTKKQQEQCNLYNLNKDLLTIPQSQSFAQLEKKKTNILPDPVILTKNRKPDNSHELPSLQTIKINSSNHTKSSSRFQSIRHQPVSELVPLPEAFIASEELEELPDPSHLPNNQKQNPVWDESIKGVHIKIEY